MKNSVPEAAAAGGKKIPSGHPANAPFFRVADSAGTEKSLPPKRTLAAGFCAAGSIFAGKRAAKPGSAVSGPAGADNRTDDGLLCFFPFIQHPHGKAVPAV